MSSTTSHPIAASESKSTFMTGIGLVAGRTEDERIYKLMKEDAVDAYRRVVQIKSDSSPDSSSADATRPRYGYTEIPKDVIQEAIATIYAKASPETRPYYDRGRGEAGDETNWVIRWMLWHTFRYRDSRNKRASVQQLSEGSQSGGSSSLPRSDRDVPLSSDGDQASQPTSTVVASTLQEGGPTAERVLSRGLPYDPTRG